MNRGKQTTEVRTKRFWILNKRDIAVVKAPMCARSPVFSFSCIDDKGFWPEALLSSEWPPPLSTDFVVTDVLRLRSL